MSKPNHICDRCHQIFSGAEYGCHWMEDGKEKNGWVCQRCSELEMMVAKEK